MLSLSIVMFLIAGMIYAVNLVVSRNEIQETMNYIASHDGLIQDAAYIYVRNEDDGAGEDSKDASDEDSTADPADTEEEEMPASGTAASQNPAGGSTDQDAAGQGDSAASQGNSAAGQASTLSRPRSDRIMQRINQSVNENSYDISEFLYEVFGTGGNSSEYSEDDAYATRYFAVIYDADGTLSGIIANHITSLTEEEAEALSDYAKGRLFHFGQYGKYYYRVSGMDDGRTMVIYLDSTNQINATTRLLYSALFLIMFGVIVTFIFVRMFSGKAIEPEIRNAELQKQFITNASHELKTPLAVIRANTEMQEMLDGENEWTQSTLRQVDRMNGLIQNLVMITRAQEKETAERIPTDVSKTVNETVDTYVPVAEQDEKKMERNIPDGITMKAVDSEIRQLVTLLLDNAIKYCDEKGTITTTLWQKGKETWLSVSNNYAEGKDVDYSRFFERFYRKNEAHTIDSSKENKGGYGIGLSIAESLVKKYSGSIRADWKDGVITFTCMLKG